MSFNNRDAALEVTKALPNGAAAVVTDGIDLGHGTRGDFLAAAELKIEAPALTTAQLPDTKTMVYDVQAATDAAFTSPITVQAGVITQTGAGGAGDAAASASVRLPVDVARYVRVQATNDGSGDASAAAVTAGLRL